MNENKGNGNYCVHCGKMVHEDDFPHHLKPGTILRNQYLVGNSIGEGGFGITYIGLDLSLDVKIAIKEFYPSGYANRNNTVSNKVTLNYHNEGEYFKNGREHFLQEAKSIAKFHRETSIVDVMAFFEENDTAYIIMEYLDGYNLSEKISKDGKFDAVELFKLFIPMMKSLDKMHKVDIIHRDISPENIRILSDGTLKLMDFGSARYFAGMDKKTMSVQFKPGYAPFEQYNKNGNQGPWTDVYGLCATIYKCITGVTPVDSLERYQNDSLKKPSELGVIIPTSLEQILMYGLAIYPDNRCKNMEELLRITESALRNEDFELKNQTNTTDIDDIYRTRIADEQYKTTFADNTYGDDYNPSVHNNTVETNQNSDQVNQTKQKRKKSILIILLVVVLLVLGGIIGIILINNSSNNEKSKATEQITKPKVTTESTDSNGDKVSVTDVSGMKLDDAVNELTSLGLKIEKTYENNSKVAKGYVIRQSIDPDREINKGDTILLYVSKGKKKNSSSKTSSYTTEYTNSTESNYINVASEVAQICQWYNSTQNDPGTKYSSNGIDYYRKNNEITKIIVPKGTDGWDYSRIYYYNNGNLYFAFIYSGKEEHRLYFSGNTLIRYIDDTKTTTDYPNEIYCPFESQAYFEAYSLL